MSTTSTSDAPDRAHLETLRDVRFEPIFIVGDHRSGTTLLHRLLAETGCFNYVSAYHVIRYEHVLTDFLAGRTAEAHREVMAEFERQGIKDRIIDKTPAVPEAPIEYGFILSDPSDQRPRLTEKTRPKFEEIARKIQYVSDRAKPLLLKNPWDVICFRDIKRWYPNARFVFIHRHPVNILNSQRQAWLSMLGSRNGFAAMIAPWYRALYQRPVQLWLARAAAKPPLRLWDRLLARHTAKMASYYMENFPALPAGSAVEIQYEELCRKPVETMNKIMDFLDAHPAEPIDWARKISPREPRLLPEVIALFHSVREKLKPYLTLQHYTLDPK